MSEALTLAGNTKKGKVLYLFENLLVIGIGHSDGYTTLRLDVHDIPFDLRQRIEDADEETMSRLETYLDDYFCDAELDSVSLIRGENCDNQHRWEDIFSYCGIVRSLIVKAKGKLVRLMNAI